MRRFLELREYYTRLQRNARLYLLSNALSGVSTGIFLVLYNLYLVALGYRPDFVGAILFVGTLGAGLAIFPAGLCVDRWSGKRILLGASLLIGLAGIGAILFRQPGPLLICAFFTGVGAAFILVINAPFLTRNSQPVERPALFSLNIALTQISVVIGEILGGALPAWFARGPTWMGALPVGLNWLLASAARPRSYQLAMLVAGVIALPSLFPLFLLREDLPRRSTAIDRQTQPRFSLPVLSPRLLLRQTWSKWLQPAWRAARAGNPFFVLILVQILTGLGAGLFIPYFNLFFVEHLKASPALFGLLDGMANGLLALTTLLAPWLARRLGRVNSIVLTRLSSLPLLLAIGFTTSLPLAATLYPLRQGLMDMAAGILLVYSMEAVEERHRGIANSVYQATFQVAWAITSSLGGLVIVTLGYAPLFVGAAFCYLGTILLLWGRFGRRHIRTARTHEEAPLSPQESLR